MMTALATVTEVTSSGQQFDVMLSCEQTTSCQGCAAQKSCGTGIVNKALGSKSLFWQLETATEVKVGQVVEIGLPEANLLQSAMVVYLFPLFGVIIGALIGHLWLESLLSMGEGIVILCAFAGAFWGMLIAKRTAHHLEQQSKTKVSLIRVLGEPIS